MPRPADLFPPDRARLFPRFETYKLHALDPARAAVAHALPGAGATQSRVAYGGAHLSFREMRARVGWDHLGTMGARGVYVDADWNVVGFELDDALEPAFTTLASLPVPIGSGAPHAEFPRALGLARDVWAVASGTGSLYVLRTSPAGAPLSGGFTARYDVPAASAAAEAVGASPEPRPFWLFAAHSAGGGVSRLLLAQAVPPAEGVAGARQAFDLFEVEVDAGHTNGLDAAPQLLHPRWVLRGADLPYWAAWARGGWLVLCEEPFTARGEGEGAEGAAVAEVRETGAQRAARERREKVNRLGLGAELPDTMDVDSAATAHDNEGDAAAAGLPGTTPAADPAAYPYSWTQSADSITLTFRVGAGTPGAGLTSVSIARGGLTLAVSPAAAAAAPPALQKFLARARHAFWGEVATDASTWTYDAAAGELEVELEKTGGARWPSVFVPDGDAAGTTADADADDPMDSDSDSDMDVPETFTAAQLAAIRAQFGAVHTRGADEPAGPHPALPALLREEMDFDLSDDEDYGEGAEGEGVGRSVLVGHVVGGGSAAPRAVWSRQPASVLSLPLSGWAGAAAGGRPASDMPEPGGLGPEPGRGPGLGGGATGVTSVTGAAGQAVPGAVRAAAADALAAAPGERAPTSVGPAGGPASSAVAAGALAPTPGGGTDDADDADGADGAVSVILKNAVDGLLFTPPARGDPGRAPWVHAGTSPALAFVLSSKRDLRLVRHVAVGGGGGGGGTMVGPGTAAPPPAAAAVLAFDAGTGDGQGNVYVYYPAGGCGGVRGDPTTAGQGVVGISGGARGALLGVGAVAVEAAAGAEGEGEGGDGGDGGRGRRRVVVALCERALVVLGGVVA